MAANPFRAELPDGSRIERNYHLVDGKRTGYGSWSWVVYDPHRRPARKKVNLYMRDKAGAMRLALEYAQRRSLGTFDPWQHTAPVQGVTFAEAVERYLREKKHKAAPDTLRTDRNVLERFSSKLPAGALTRHVEPARVADFINAQKPKRRDGTPGGERSPQSKRRMRATLLHFFAWAVKHGLAASNPAEGVALPKGSSARRDHITPEETAAILRKVEAAEVLTGESRAWLKDWILFGAATGLRPGEQRALRWSAVRMAEQVIEVGRGHRVKTVGSRRTVPLPPEAIAVLQRRTTERDGEGDGYVFTGANGGPVNDRYLSKQLQRFATEAEIEKNVTAYSLRHAYGTRLALFGAPLYVIAQVMGTSVQMIERHYAHYQPEAGAALVARVFGSVKVAA